MEFHQFLFMWALFFRHILAWFSTRLLSYQSLHLMRLGTRSVIELPSEVSKASRDFSPAVMLIKPESLVCFLLYCEWCAVLKRLVVSRGLKYQKPLHQEISLRRWCWSSLNSCCAFCCIVGDVLCWRGQFPLDQDTWINNLATSEDVVEHDELLFIVSSCCQVSAEIFISSVVLPVVGTAV